jgi:hypothetical protein
LAAASATFRRVVGVEIRACDESFGDELLRFASGSGSILFARAVRTGNLLVGRSLRASCNAGCASVSGGRFRPFDCQLQFRVKLDKDAAGANFCPIRRVVVVPSTAADSNLIGETKLPEIDDSLDGVRWGLVLRI